MLIKVLSILVSYHYLNNLICHCEELVNQNIISLQISSGLWKKLGEVFPFKDTSLEETNLNLEQTAKKDSKEIELKALDKLKHLKIPKLKTIVIRNEQPIFYSMNENKEAICETGLYNCIIFRILVCSCDDWKS